MREELELSKIVFNLKQFQSDTVQEFVITVVNQTIVQSKKYHNTLEMSAKAQNHPRTLSSIDFSRGL